MPNENLRSVRYCFAEYLKTGDLQDKPEEQQWSAFVVACQTGTGVELFCPPWRSRRKVPVALLEELTADHLVRFPWSTDARWSEICERVLEEGKGIHPIELLRERRSQ